MLSGTILYYPNGNNPQISESLQRGITSDFEEDAEVISYRYDFIGEDTSATLMGALSSHSYEAISFMAGDEDSDNQLFKRRFDCTMAGVKVDTVVVKNDDGSKTKYGVNYDLFCRLAALIRYSKNLCRQDNIEGYVGLADASGEFSPESETTYIIPQFIGSSVKLGSITLKLGEIKNMTLTTPYFSIDIKDVYESEIFSKVQNAHTKGISFSYEMLGFFVAQQKIQVEPANGLYSTIEEVIAAHPDRDFSWLLNKDYRIVTDDTLEEVCQKFMNVPDDDFIFYDTETSGLDINFKSRTGDADQCVGIILSYEDGVSYFFPMQMRTMTNLCGGDHFYFMNKYMKPILETKQLVAHNMSFDWKVAYIYGINANILHDTMAMLYLTLCAEKSSFPSALKPASKELLGRDSLELGDFTATGSWDASNEFWDLPPEIVRLYACADTDNTRGIFWYIMKNNLLQRYNATRVYQIEIQFSFAVAYQEFYGHHIAVDAVGTLTDKLDQSLESTYKEMVEIVGHEFNPSSSPQLINICYNELGMPEMRDFKSGRLTTNKDTLKKFAEVDDGKAYPFATKMLEYRKDDGVRKIVKQFPQQMTSDGFLFSSVFQYGTTTGRVSIHAPNYQSYNDIVKKNVVPRDGFYMTDTDYSSVEYRVLGSMAGNKMIMEGFIDPDFDYHAYQAARMYNIPYSAVSKDLRSQAKGINFGLPYGMGDGSLGMRIFGARTEETKLKAAALRKKYFQGQEDVERFFTDARDGGERNGYTETYFGRRRYYNRATTKRSEIRRQAGNAVIQGTAADIYKLAVGRLFLRICKEGWLGKVLLTGFIHDEVLCEVHNSIDPMVWLKALREEFEVKIEGWCPLYMGFGFGMSWYEAKKTEIPVQLQWELVSKYGEQGYPNWTGDGYALCKSVPDMLRDFSIRHIYDVLSSEESRDKEIKVSTNKDMFDVLSDDVAIYTKALAAYTGDNISDVEEVLKADHLAGVLKDDNGEVMLAPPHSEFNEKKEKYLFDKGVTSNEAIDVFCILHGYDRSTISVLDLDDSSSATSASIDVDISDTGDDEYDSLLADAKAQAEARIRSFGLFADIESKVITLRILPAQYMTFIRNKSLTKEQIDAGHIFAYAIKLRDMTTGMEYDTPMYLPATEISAVQQLYIRYIQMETAVVH